MYFKLWLHEAEKYEVPNGRILQFIKVPIPSVKQQGDFTCGAAALRAIASFYKTGPTTECDFAKAVNASPQKGTHPKDLIKAAKSFGLKVIAKEHMTINELKTHLNKQHPIICNIQAWGDDKTKSKRDQEYKKRNDGHYVIAIGFNDTHIYFEDPTLKGNRGRLTYEDFDKRWHDKETNGDKTDHLGIVIWKDTSDTDAQYLTKATKIK